MAVLSSMILTLSESKGEVKIFKDIFVEPRKTIEKIYSYIRDDIPRPRQKRNLLIRAARGMGISSLFIFLKLQFKDRHQLLLDRIIPVFFNEMEIINSPGKLIRRIYEIVIADPFFFHKLAYPQEWKESLGKAKESNLDCFSILKDNMNLEGKRLVLFIENVQSNIFKILISKETRTQGNMSSREIINHIINDTEIILICSIDENSALSHELVTETFDVYEFKPIEDFLALFEKRMKCDSNFSLLSHKRKLKDKIKAFEYLTDRNARLLVYLYECFTLNGIWAISFHLDYILDRSTPLFELFLERNIDSRSHEIIDAMVRRDGNSTIKEIAKDINSDEATVRTLISRLRLKKIVKKLNRKREHSDVYLICSRMFYLWYKKCFLQEEGEIYEFFVHFVEFFFNSSKSPDSLTDDRLHNYQIDKKLEKPVYEIVRIKKDDTILLEKLSEADSLKSANINDAVDLLRIICNGYRILIREFGKPYQEQADKVYHDLLYQLNQNNHDMQQALLSMVKLEYAEFMESTGRFEDAFKFYLELEQGLNDSQTDDMSCRIKRGLFLYYIRTCRKSYVTNNDLDDAGALFEKSLRYINHLTIEDFCRGFYYEFIFPIIDRRSLNPNPFLTRIKQVLVSVENEFQNKGEIIGFFYSVFCLFVKEEDFDDITKNLHLLLREILGLIKGRKEGIFR